MLSRNMAWAGFTATAALLGAMYGGCGGSSSDTGKGGAGGGAGTTDAGGAGGGTGGGGSLPPPRPTGTIPPDGPSDVVMAMSAIYLGDVDPKTDKPDTKAWRYIGYNIDGKMSTKDATDHCKPQPGGLKSNIQDDGEGGIDNSFGKNIFLGIIIGLASDASQRMNDAIKNGDFTIMVKMDKLGPKDDYTPLTAALYGGGKMGKAPAWDGSDQWPLLNELLDNGDKNSPKVKFPSSYMSKRVWVSGDYADVNLSIGIGGYNLGLSIRHAVISEKIAADNKSGDSGIISGVLETAELKDGIKKVAGRISASLCQGSTIDSVLQQIGAASDIMKNGTNGPEGTCDGISIGLGFKSKAVQLGAVLPPATPGNDPCAADGGGGTGGGGGSGGAGGANPDAASGD